MIRINVTPDEWQKAAAFDELPDDRTYVLELEKIEERQGNKGPYANATFVIKDDEEHTGRLWDVWPLPREEKLLGSPKDRKAELKRSFRLRDFAEAVGYKWGDTFDPTDLIGSRVRATIQNEVYEGKSRSRPDRYLKV